MFNFVFKYSLIIHLIIWCNSYKLKVKQLYLWSFDPVTKTRLRNKKSCVGPKFETLNFFKKLQKNVFTLCVLFKYRWVHPVTKKKERSSRTMKLMLSGEKLRMNEKRRIEDWGGLYGTGSGKHKMDENWSSKKETGREEN